jgi:hypothetical protein
MNAAASEAFAIPQLAELWSRTLAARNGVAAGPLGSDENAARLQRDKVLIYGLGLGLRETLSFLYDQAPSFEGFVQWIVAQHGGSIDPRTVARVNAALSGEPVEPLDDGTPALTPAELEFFDEHGYVVLRNAVVPAAARAAEDAIWQYLRMDRDDPNGWYGGSHGRSIWVPFLHHPALDANRASARIASAFAQLWRRRDLWVTVDQCGFNPPELPDWTFPGQALHWDVSLVPPVPFGLQGILYLTDTAADQGAFTCVPGFHRRIDDWLRGLPPGADPRREDPYALGPIPVAAGAGDLVIWHHALPHGASANRATRPRIVQYIALNPTTTEHSETWK